MARDGTSGPGWRSQQGDSSLSRRRVVVTGLGIVSPIGSTVASAWDGIVNGRSGIRTITKLDVCAFPVRIGGEVVGFNAEDYMSLKDVRKFDPFVPFGFAAAVQAIKDSGFQVTEENSARIGVAIGAGIGGLSTIEENTAKWLEAKSPRKISPFFIPGSIINAAAGQVSIHYGLRGPNLALVTACTTSTHSIGIGGALHPVRRRGHHDRGRRRDGVHAARSRQLSARPARLSLRNDEPAAREPAVGPATATAS